MVVDGDRERMLTFYRFTKAHWPPLRTSNPIESLFEIMRLRTDVAKQSKKVSNAIAVM